MQVKIFTGGPVDRIEKEINDWLTRNNPKISFIKQSESVDSDGDWSVTISIFYEPVTNEENALSILADNVE